MRPMSGHICLAPLGRVPSIPAPPWDQSSLGPQHSPLREGHKFLQLLFTPEMFEAARDLIAFTVPPSPPRHDRTPSSISEAPKRPSVLSRGKLATVPCRSPSPWHRSPVPSTSRRTGEPHWSPSFQHHCLDLVAMPFHGHPTASPPSQSLSWNPVIRGEAGSPGPIDTGNSSIQRHGLDNGRL